MTPMTAPGGAIAGKTAEGTEDAAVRLVGSITTFNTPHGRVEIFTPHDATEDDAYLDVPLDLPGAYLVILGNYFRLGGYTFYDFDDYEGHVLYSKDDKDRMRMYGIPTEWDGPDGNPWESE